jgi:DUF1365 family protein
MSGALQSRLLVGRVAHSRLTPRAHAFTYGLFMMAVDLDELPALAAQLRLFGTRRGAPLRLDARDHLGITGRADGPVATARALRAAAVALLDAHGVREPVGRITLVAHARVLGYVFNPVGFFVCYRADGTTPLAVIADVHNTFGERHAYVLPAATAAGEGRWMAKKAFHVSPFFTLDGTYQFALQFAAAGADVRIDLHRDGRPVFVSHLALAARPLTDRSLVGVLLRWPLMTAHVIGAIHWEALRLWRKGLTYHPKPRYDPDAARLTRP